MVTTPAIWPQSTSTDNSDITIRASWVLGVCGKAALQHPGHSQVYQSVTEWGSNARVSVRAKIRRPL